VGRERGRRQPGETADLLQLLGLLGLAPSLGLGLLGIAPHLRLYCEGGVEGGGLLELLRVRRGYRVGAASGVGVVRDRERMWGKQRRRG